MASKVVFRDKATGVVSSTVNSKIVLDIPTLLSAANNLANILYPL